MLIILTIRHFLSQVENVDESVGVDLSLDTLTIPVHKLVQGVSNVPNGLVNRYVVAHSVLGKVPYLFICVIHVVSVLIEEVIILLRGNLLRIWHQLFEDFFKIVHLILFILLYDHFL